MSDLTCSAVVELIMAYLDHDLDPAQRHAFEAHVAVCDGCVAYIRSYEQAVRLGRTAFESPGDPAAQQSPKQLIEAIIAARRRVT